VVFDRRAGQRQAVAGAEQARGLGGLALGVLDRLGLVEHGIVERGLAELLDIATHQAIGRDDQVVVVESAVVLVAVGPGIGQHAQLGGELLRLIDPVKHDAAWHDDDRGQVLDRCRQIDVLPRFAGDVQVVQVRFDAELAGLDHREDLDGLTQAHVVGQDAAHREASQEGQPAQAVRLVRPKRPAEGLGRFDGVDAVKGAEAFADLLEACVDLDELFVVQQRVEHRRL